MDLRYSREDEAFRADVRAWLEVEVSAHGPPPPSDDWPARRAYDTAWQRKLHDAGLAGIAWPRAFVTCVSKPGPLVLPPSYS